MKHLFLCGGGRPFTKRMGEMFSKLTDKIEGEVAVLFLEREGWREFCEDFKAELSLFGIEKVRNIPLDSTPVDDIKENLAHANGIIILGGDTNRYAEKIVDTGLGEIVKSRYEEGCPVVGFSAGALLTPEICVISAKDNSEGVFQYRKGIGLLNDTVLSVHFQEWSDEGHLFEAVETLRPMWNYGINEKCFIYLNNDEVCKIEGNGAFTCVNGLIEELHAK